MYFTTRIVASVLFCAALMSSFAQGPKKAASVDECTACKFMVSCNQEAEKRNIVIEQVLLKNGFAQFAFGNSEADSKWVVSQFKALEQEMSNADARFCDFCTPFAEFATHPKTRYELVPTKTGAVMYMVSSDKAAVAEVHKAFKKMSEAMPKEGGGDARATTGGKATGVFLGKGDGVNTCPVMGGKVNKNVSVEYNGKTVYFCCAGCIPKFKENPSAYLRD